MKENKRQKIYRTIMLIVVVATVTFIVTSIINYQDSIKYVISSKFNTNVNQKIDTALSAITEIIEDKYIGEIDEDKLIDGALKGMVASVGDIYTEYYTKDELDQFTTSTLGNFVGLGVYMQANFITGNITILSTIPNSPAEEAGLREGDLIIKANDKEYKAEEITELSNDIKGEEGTKVKLTIKRADETLDIEVERRQIHINYVVGEMLEDNIGCISIETFDEDCEKDFINEYEKLKNEGAKALIIDLRNNGGGLVDEAINIAELMCNKNDVLLISTDKDGNKKTTISKKAPVIEMPIVVIVNEASASATEILAGALKDNGKAEIVGEKTFGKGVIQELIRLSNGGALKVTSLEYFTPKENKINEIGIEPDYKVEGEEEQMKKAIEVIKEKMK